METNGDVSSCVSCACVHGGAAYGLTCANMCRATQAALPDRIRVFQTLLQQAVRLNRRVIESSVCLSYGVAVIESNPQLAVRCDGALYFFFFCMGRVSLCCLVTDVLSFILVCSFRHFLFLRSAGGLVPAWPDRHEQGTESLGCHRLQQASQEIAGGVACHDKISLGAVQEAKYVPSMSLSLSLELS